MYLNIYLIGLKTAVEKTFYFRCCNPTTRHPRPSPPVTSPLCQTRPSSELQASVSASTPPSTCGSGGWWWQVTRNVLLKITIAVCFLSTLCTLKLMVAGSSPMLTPGPWAKYLGGQALVATLEPGEPWRGVHILIIVSSLLQVNTAIYTLYNRTMI